jgi:hypothetical protein
MLIQGIAYLYFLRKQGPDGNAFHADQRKSKKIPRMSDKAHSLNHISLYKFFVLVEDEPCLRK